MDGEAVVVDLSSGQYFALNGTGLLLWQALTDGCRMSRLVELLVQRFGLTSDVAGTAVDGFLAGLHAQDLLEFDDR